mmetsp:Transcript_19316/g.41262  ORF Transcript_19316/g.41262 Transcript_19316/m.41262 type:complete len:270 (-) Transcript_19316:156-965(-)
MGVDTQEDLGVLEYGLVQEDPTERGLLFSESSKHPGHLPDDPTPYMFSNPKYFGTTTSLISTDVVLKKRDFFVPFLADSNKAGQPWCVYGGAIANTHDQMTAIPVNRREGGLYMHPITDALDLLLPLMFGDQDRGAFPGFVGHNHNVRHGPLKADWTKTCPLTFTKEEKDEFCISEQKAVWGTELLVKLEKFKAEVDPDHIMTCATGVGYESKAIAKQDGDSEVEEDDGSKVKEGDGNTDAGQKEKSAGHCSAASDIFPFAVVGVAIFV